MLRDLSAYSGKRSREGSRYREGHGARAARTGAHAGLAESDRRGHREGRDLKGRMRSAPSLGAVRQSSSSRSDPWSTVASSVSAARLCVHLLSTLKKKGATSVSAARAEHRRGAALTRAKLAPLLASRNAVQRTLRVESLPSGKTASGRDSTAPNRTSTRARRNPPCAVEALPEAHARRRLFSERERSNGRAPGHLHPVTTTPEPHHGRAQPGCRASTDIGGGSPSCASARDGGWGNKKCDECSGLGPPRLACATSPPAAFGDLASRGRAEPQLDFEGPDAMRIEGNSS